VIDYESANNIPIAHPAMIKQVLGEMPAMVEVLLNTKELKDERLRWTGVAVFNMLELMTSIPP
jgi:hypothetical protein